jgi:hypothetical protein
MPTVARIAVHSTFGVLLLGGATACASQNPAGPYAGEGGALGDDFGFVGSGGGGRGYGHDGGTAAGDSGSGDGGPGGVGTLGYDAGSFDSSGSQSAGNDSSGGNDGGPENDSGAAGGGNAFDGGSGVGVTFQFPPGFFASLAWVIDGPSGHYSGIVYFGDAGSLEFVAGGIQAGSGYTITLAGNDRDGDPCSGTSAPFEVVPGEVTAAGLVLSCARMSDASEPAVVTTGGVGVDAGVGLRGP